MLTSSQNPLIKQVRALQRSRKAREAAGLFVVEGIQGVLAALEGGADIHALLWSPERLTSERAREAVEQAQARGVRVEAVSADLFATLSERDNPVGLLAVVEQRGVTLDAMPLAADTLLVALVGVADPGNVGTILRSVDAVGGSGLVLVGETVDPYHPTTVKASTSTLFSVPVMQVPEVEALLAWADARGVTVIATSDRGATSYWEARYVTPLLLLMGSEAHGLPDAVLQRVPLTVRIPMRGTADSLNLGVATSLLLYEVRRQQQG